jgi:hypothetical protein
MSQLNASANLWIFNTYYKSFRLSWSFWRFLLKISIGRLLYLTYKSMSPVYPIQGTVAWYGFLSLLSLFFFWPKSTWTSGYNIKNCDWYNVSLHWLKKISSKSSASVQKSRKKVLHQNKIKNLDLIIRTPREYIFCQKIISRPCTYSIENALQYIVIRLYRDKDGEWWIKLTKDTLYAYDMNTLWATADKSSSTSVKLKSWFVFGKSIIQLCEHIVARSVKPYLHLIQAVPRFMEIK